MDEVQDDLSGSIAALRIAEGIFMDTDTGGGGEAGLYVIVVKGDLVEAGSCVLRVVAEAAAEASVRIVGSSGIKLQGTSGRHYEDVSQVGMAGAAEMGVAETDDCRIIVAVACAGLVDLRLVFSVYVVRNGVSVRTQLDASEGNAGPGESVSHSVSSDERVDVAGLGLTESCGACQQECSCQ